MKENARKKEKEERRMSPPWDDSSLDLFDLTREELMERVVKVRRECVCVKKGPWDCCGRVESRPTGQASSEQRRVSFVDDGGMKKFGG